MARMDYRGGLRAARAVAREHQIVMATTLRHTDLVEHTEEAAAYADLKRKRAAAHPNDTLSYTEAKSGFIAKVLERAEVASVDARHDHHDPGSRD